ncbi:MAG TPA: carbohydrate porin [Aromatoleum sp.]|uniref:carbohydrate porin n=1 Tax=Aromatoleum sp. TaxID=2307007 RepID=UPI002B4833DA|nr:carbohydrate porin [Aromatoleum sp.]HJV24703.1 carbohydrate porin [Aromatoleum sp.]
MMFRQTAIAIGIALAFCGSAGAAEQGKSKRVEDLEARIERLEEQLRAVTAAAQQAANAAQQAASTAQQATTTAQQASDVAQKADTTASAAKAASDAQPAALTKAAAETASSFEFHGYARSGTVSNNDMFTVKGVGPYITPAGNLGGAVGRLGLETDTYVEAKLIKNFRDPDGSWGQFGFMLADGVNSNNDWTGGENGVNVRWAYAELGSLPMFKGTALENGSIWAGKRFDKKNFDIHFFDSDFIFLSGTGAGFYDAQITPDWKTNLSVYGRDFLNDSSESIKSYVLTSNNYIGNWQLMLNGMRATNNDEGDTGRATRGYHGLLAYHAPSFYGLTDGLSKFGVLYGHGLGAEVKRLGAVGNLLDEARALRLMSFGIADLSPTWKVSPAVMAEVSKDRFNKGDDYKWASANLRLINSINKNFAMQYEGSYQYMNLDSTFSKAKGDFYKLTVAPTFKLDTGAGFFARPELRLFASWMKWDKQLNGFSYDGSANEGFGATKFKGSSKWLVGAQMEVWF